MSSPPQGFQGTDNGHCGVSWAVLVQSCAGLLQLSPSHQSCNASLLSDRPSARSRSCSLRMLHGGSGMSKLLRVEQPLSLLLLVWALSLSPPRSLRRDCQGPSASANESWMCQGFLCICVSADSSLGWEQI